MLSWHREAPNPKSSPFPAGTKSSRSGVCPTPAPRSAGSSCLGAGRGICSSGAHPGVLQGAGLAGIYRGRGAAGASAEQTAPSIPARRAPGTKETFPHRQRGQRATKVPSPRPPVAGTEPGDAQRVAVGSGTPGRAQAGTLRGLAALGGVQGEGSEGFPAPAFPWTPSPHWAGLYKHCTRPEPLILLGFTQKRARRA